MPRCRFQALLCHFCLWLLLCIGSVGWSAPQVYSRFIHLNDSFDISPLSTSIAQDHHGMLWLGTQHGLYRFDGGDLTRFQADAATSNSLSADWVTSLLVEGTDTLWVGTRYGGLNRLNLTTERFEQLRFAIDADDAPQNEISVLYQDAAGQIWIGTNGAGVFYWDRQLERIVALELPGKIDDVSTAYINDIWMDDAQQLWLAIGDAPLRTKGRATGGIIRWDPQLQQGQGWHPGNSDLSHDSATSLVVHPDKGLLIALYGGGLWRMNPSSLQPEPMPMPENMQRIRATSIGLDATGNIWVASDGQGLWLYLTARQRWQQFQYHPEFASGLRNSAITRLYFDGQGTLWLLSQSGFSLLGPVAQQVRTLPFGRLDSNLLGAANVFGIEAVSEQEVWIANREAGVALFNPLSGKLQRFALPEDDRGPSLVRAVLKEQDWLWVGTDRGLYRLYPETAVWEHQALPEIGGPPTISIFYPDAQGRLWLGSRGAGLYLLDQQRQLVRHYHTGSEQHPLPFDTITSMVMDPQGYFWLGSLDRGLLRGDAELTEWQHWRQFDGSEHGLVFNGIQLIYLQNGHVWVRAGNLNHRWLDRTEPPFFKAYPTDESVDEALVAADEFRLLYRYHWLPGSGTLLELNQWHGMQETTWIGAWELYNGMIYRGGSSGMDYFQPQALPSEQPMPAVQLSRFSLFNQTVQPGSSSLPQALPYLDRLVLRYKEDMFSIRFAVPSLLHQQQLQYRYRLQGFDRDWILTSSNERIATYTRLPPGTYQFEVAARLGNGEWQEPALLSIQVLPPWWMTWWFRALVITAIVFALWLWLHLKMQAERAMRRELQRQVTKRTMELKEKHDALEASNKDLMLLQQIGREITASLQLDQVLSRCHQMLSELIDVHVMVIGLYRPQLEQIEFVFWQENGQQLPNFSIDAKDSEVLASLCFNRGQEIQVSQRSDFYKYFSSMPQPLCGEPMQSVLYIPLMANQQAVGVFSVQSPNPNAYSASQLDLLRTLASTIAIAVVNADTFTRLQQTQQQLVTQEKMASLGGLVAGVAHEINTPLGICVTATSHLKAEFEQVYSAFAEKKLQQSQFKRFLQHLHDGLKILEVNTERAAALVQSFKQVSVDQSADGSRDIELSGYLQDVLLSLQPQLKTIACQFELNCPENIEWTTDAGALAQILTNLVMNSIRHAFAETTEPKISLTVSRQGQQLQLDYRDNGCGMGPDDLKRLFEPFYTTKRSLGGTGLGAHIVYNLVTVRFKGQIEVQSAPGQGLHYRLTLPFGT
ncbi:ATP-binding protein [Alkalimonas delamerensis]|uniref:histidine kinase n=1 Tax=Alkalimonas delamerensis TaxID=265981 RepID=A0ABT9GT61_9GAMM|nr:ATP-binding protein [Alkalimonas delamerensis]MDP4530142.1 ATP-binding protein [Alkalimonas delamerensis]